jgi:hypothetical protein
MATVAFTLPCESQTESSSSRANKLKSNNALPEIEIRGKKLFLNSNPKGVQNFKTKTSANEKFVCLRVIWSKKTVHYKNHERANKLHYSAVLPIIPFRDRSPFCMFSPRFSKDWKKMGVWE